jgi:hypothetical protein
MLTIPIFLLELLNFFNSRYRPLKVESNQDWLIKEIELPFLLHFQDIHFQLYYFVKTGFSINQSDRKKPLLSSR